MHSVKQQSAVKDWLVVETESYYTPQAGLELAVLLPQPPPGCCDHMHVAHA